MDLFEYNRQNQREKFAPLAEKLRPKTLNDVLGQDEITKDGGMIKNAMKTNNLPSILLYGPPGTGKTTIAEIIAKEMNMNFFKVSAVSSGIKELREVVEKSAENLRMNMGRSILFVDEIHRFSTSQQDFLLPYVEAGDLVLIGATTENPFFAVNKALISRLILIELKSLNSEALEELLDRALNLYSKENNLTIEISPEAKEFLVKRADGDARRLINSFEVSVLNGRHEKDKLYIDEHTVRDNFMNATLKYDSTDEHYDTISAFIKSMRGSDPDAAIFYLAKMLLSGEDPRFIARRMVIFASEDVSNADPMALSVATNAFYATTVIGMPEVRINLAQAAVYLACAPKNNSSYLAINEAMSFIRKNGSYRVPSHLRDAHYQGSEKLGVGGYIYPHSFENGYVDQSYLPDEIKNIKFYEPKDIGYEKEMSKYLRRIKGEDE